ncbi:MAG: hypothetical protein ACKVIW_07650 [bacterium]
MNRFTIWIFLAFFFSTFSFVAVPTAQAVRLTSSGSNDEYVAVSNYAFSYSSTPLKLRGVCNTNGAKDSSWDAPSTCDDSGENCWAVSGGGGESASLEVKSMRKAFFHYYAKDHKASGQGTCTFYIGSTYFGLSFDYESTGVDFTLSLQVLDTGDSTWRGGAGEVCYETGTGGSGSVNGVEYSTEDSHDEQLNTICNEDYIISLVADPEISDGAVQSAPSTSSSLAKAGEFTPEPAGRRRFADRVSPEGRWLVTSDSEGETMNGVLVSGTEESIVEFATCSQTSSNDNDDPGLASYIYNCDFISEDGTSKRSEQVSLLGTHMRARALSAPNKIREVRTSGTEIAIGTGSAIRQLAEIARVTRLEPTSNKKKGSIELSSSSSDGDVVVWHAVTKTGRIAMLQYEQEGRLEIVRHSSTSLSPSFTTCSEFSQDQRTGKYLCQGNLRCTGDDCPETSWSAASIVDFPNALFKNRPCQVGQGKHAIKPKLRLAKLGRPGNKARLKFDTSFQLAPGEKVRPDKDGFRFLVEDADGSTVVDLDLPSNSASRNTRNAGNKHREEGPWSVSKDKRSFRYRSEGADGMVSTVKIKRSDKRTNEWSVGVFGKKGIFGNDKLLLPLRASLSLDPTDSNSPSCSSVNFSQDDQPDCLQQEDDGGSKIICRSR